MQKKPTIFKGNKIYFQNYTKNFIELKDRELKDKEVKVNRKAENLFFKSIIVSSDEMVKF